MTDDSLPTEALLDGRYHLRECVGQGGMARVYRADDSLLGRTVAIKMLRAETQEGAASDRARSEMTVLASLNHPALVTLYDAELRPGRAEYLVMEFIDGPTLAERIAQGPLSSAEVAALAADLAEALHVVHGAGIVHRDIKPSNVLLTGCALGGSRSGAKLADFGISVLVDAARVTTPGTVIGTAAYLAPEQLNGASPAPPVDIYALGLVLREALTGERAFAQAEGIGATLARLIEQPDIPDSVGPEWAALLRRMTATDPADRPTAAGVFAAVADITRGAPLPPRPTVPAPIAAAAFAAQAQTAGSGATRTRVLPAPAPHPSGALRSRAPRRQRARWRRGLVTGVVAAAVALTVVVTVVGSFWAAGDGSPGPVLMRVDTEPAPRTTPTPAVVVAETVPEEEAPAVIPVDAPAPAPGPQNDTKADGKADKKAEKAQDAAEKAAEKAEKEAEKAQEKAEREAEKAQERAEKDTEKAQKKNDPED